MEYIAEQSEEFIVLQTEPYQLIHLEQGQHLATSQEFTSFSTQNEALEFIRNVYPDFELNEDTDDADDISIPVPTEVTPGKFMVALLDTDEALYDQLMSSKRIQAGLLENTVRRDSLLLRQFAEQYNITDEMIDQLFVRASRIRL